MSGVLVASSQSPTIEKFNQFAELDQHELLRLQVDLSDPSFKLQSFSFEVSELEWQDLDLELEEGPLMALCWALIESKGLLSQGHAVTCWEQVTCFVLETEVDHEMGLAKVFVFDVLQQTRKVLWFR